MDAKTLIILIPVLLVPWIVLFFVMRGSNKKVIKNYKKLGEKYDLNIDLTKKVGMKNHPHASGTYRRRNIKIESVIRDSIDGKKIIPHTILFAECNNPDKFSFRVVKRSKQNRASYSEGSILIEDNEFDDKFIVQTNDPQRLRRIFDFNTKFKLDQVHALGFNGTILLHENNLQYIERGLLKDDDSLMRVELIMHEFCDIAETMKYN
ncbi:MAG: hypothetical protein IT281_01240 [Ignavibacteria bacterium]|nr:hypothetical protein [Ignavibacteria bacterium]MCC7158145.1 hypothetical protein [Ignavibacteria bacterium]